MAGRRQKASGGGCGTLLLLAVAVTYLADAGPGLWVMVSIVAATAVGLWLLWRWLSRPKTPTAKELYARMDAITSMVGSSSGKHLEILVADLLGAMGHKANVLGGSGDQGVDVITYYNGERVAVQCKNYKRRVGNKPIQEVYAGARYHGCQKAWVVAPAGYTKGAQDLARSTGVSLYEENDLRRWIAAVDNSERARARTSSHHSGPTAPARRACAGCGAGMEPAQAFCTSCGARSFETRAGA